MSPDPDGAPVGLVGNDVVDLRSPRCAGMHLDRRFLLRVFTPRERSAIESASDPDRTLWGHWAAKEAAYKVVSKLEASPPVFEHVAFEVRAHDHHAVSVTYRGTVLPVRLVWTDAWVHALAVAPGSALDGVRALDVAPLHGVDVPGGGRDDPAWTRFLEERFTGRERAAVYGPSSAAVRILARAAVAEVLGARERDVEIVCPGARPGRTPPTLLVRGESGHADVSLSHDGAWLAWAVG